jgi:L-arabinokinase
MRVALVCSAHGYGHTTRQLAVGRALRDRGATPVLFSSAPRGLVDEWLPGAELHSCAVDVGIVQRDSVYEDVAATAAALGESCAAERVDALAQLLASCDRAVVDVAPAALEACRRAGVPCAAVGNFDWAWIYEHYPPLRGPAQQLRQWQAPHVGASLWPGPGLTGFRATRQLGLLARVGRPVLPPASVARVLVSFGGFGLEGLDALLPRLAGVRWVLASHGPTLKRPDVERVEGVAYPDLVASVDLVLSKPGYGILGEALATGTRMLWLPRGAFPEAPALIETLQAHGGCIVDGGALDEAVPRALARPRPAPVAAPAAQQLADWALSARFPGW